jgi:tetratricopeptide (TPR) repeat protein
LFSSACSILAASASQLFLGVPQAVKDSEWSLAPAQRALARGRASEAEQLCSQRVAKAPKDAAAWHLLGLSRHKLGDPSRASEALARAASLDAGNAHYQHVLGTTLAEDGQLDRAIAAFKRALKIDETLAEAHNDLGTAYFEKQWHEQAEQCFRRAIRLRPDHGIAHANLGAALRAQGQLIEGRRAFQRALLLKVRGALPRFLRWRVGSEAAGQRAEALRELRRSLDNASSRRDHARVRSLVDQAATRLPDDAEAAYLAAEALSKVDDAEQALTLARKAADLDPARAAYQMLLARLLVHKRHIGAAIAAAEAASRLEPDAVEVQGTLSTTLRLGGRFQDAEVAARRAIALDPGRAQGFEELAMVLRAQQRLADAESAARQAIALAGQDARCLAGLGLILKDAGRVREARAIYQSLQSRLGSEKSPPASLCQSLGTLALECAGDLDAARGWFRKAAQGGESVEATLSESVADLLEWRFSSGWEKFEARKRLLGHRDRHELFAGIPQWDGTPLRGLRLLVYGEQGVGDEIMYASMLPDLQRDVDDVTFMCDARTQPLISRSFPRVEVLRATQEGVDAVRSRVAYAHAVGSLGRFYRPDAAAFPPRAGYLRTDRAMVEAWRARLRELPGQPKIGISWRGGLQHTGRHRRSLSLERLEKVLRIPGAAWVSLQHGEVREEIAGFARSTGISVNAFPDVTNDLDELASLIDALDFVVTVCNTTVHVAGALDKPLLVLAPAVPLWSYGIRGDRMLWYPSARVLRQDSDESWSAAIAQVEQAVAARVTGA